ncbi:MAG: nucleotidyl transferase AbiEii/AbiGii toxin family protein [Gammaproteobacteria bacterium]
MYKREHTNIEPHLSKSYRIENSWYRGECNVLTYSIEELLATKLKALYQRKKGRDLYDFWYVLKQSFELNTSKVVDIFQKYMTMDDLAVSRAEFEMNLSLKIQDVVFSNDMGALLSADNGSNYTLSSAYQYVLKQFIEKLKGNPWKG